MISYLSSADSHAVAFVREFVRAVEPGLDAHTNDVVRRWWIDSQIAEPVGGYVDAAQPGDVFLAPQPATQVLRRLADVVVHEPIHLARCRATGEIITIAHACSDPACSVDVERANDYVYATAKPIVERVLAEMDRNGWDIDRPAPRPGASSQPGLPAWGKVGLALLGGAVAGAVLVKISRREA